MVDKSIFAGEWWYAITAIDVDFDAASILGTFEGDMGWADLGVDKGESGTIARIRWVIDEDFLYAHRTYELVDGGNQNGQYSDFLGQPIAAFQIESHVDIQRDYNPVTGESRNVRIENTSDRRWYEREFMRVDWSQNHIDSFYFPGLEWKKSSSAFLIQENGAHSDFPESWQPEFVRIGDDPNYRFADEWPEEQSDIVHYMSFVIQSIWEEEVNFVSLAVAHRHAFLRVPPEHEFASSNQTHEEFDRFGLFRQHGRTYTRGGLDRSVLGQSCTVDADCDGGACSAEGLCEGGWTPDYGETDFLTFYTPRHNLYRNALTEETCTTDADCMQFADSYCDAAASVCTTPRAERELRTIDYWLNPGFPEYLVQDAMMVVGTWNEPFMQGVRAIQGRPAPDYASIRISCQSADPTDYCFCGSAEDEGGTCVGRYDPFVSPEQYLGLGVADPYRCSIESGPFIEPPNPVEYAQYAGAYAHRFTGSECRMRLHVNTCDRDPLGDCEELGDIRYQFFNLVPANFGFSGVASPLSDPTNGELITANANMSQISVEQAIETAVEYFPVLRGEPGAQERYLSGENLLGYFDRVGRTQHPVALAPTLSGNLSGGDFSDAAGDDSAFPSVPTGDQLAEAVRHKVDEVIDRVQTYQGPEGRAQLFTDRMSRLAGTHLEAQLVGSLGVDGLEAIHQHYDDPSLLPADTSATDDAVLDRVSPFRDNFLPSIFRERNEELDLGQQNWCFHGESLYRSAQWQYWADAFEGVAPAEASIRLQQWMMRQVMFHEIGHSIGLRHNFAASYDRNNYHDAYFNIARSHPLPILDDYDLPENGGNADGFVGGAEITNYYRGLRQVRDTRAALGIENTMSSSAMDYVFAGSMHLGRYDRAAALFSYFGLIEAFEGDPRYLFPDSLNGITQSDIFDRTLWTYYRGGERCQVDRDCPYGPDADSLIEQPLFQRCIQNPRTVEFPTPCEEESRGCICSAIFDDFNDYVGGFAFRPPGSEVDYYPVEYLFCTDERTHDISWCNRFDFGESFQETVENFRRDWEEAYPHEYFRRFRTDGARGFATQNAVIDAVKIYQHFYYRYIYEPEYRTNLGPLGFLDQVLASVDIMHWLIEIVNLPDTGSYVLDTDHNRWLQVSDALNAPDSDISLAPGTGYELWSSYQDGQNGWFRMEQAGTFFDKFFALYALAERNWNLDFTYDERLFINFYDFFGVEMSEFFGGLILDEPSWFAPRASIDTDGEPTVEHISVHRGLLLGECLSDENGSPEPCVGDTARRHPGPYLDGDRSQVMRSWAATLALAYFPVYYDTTYEQRLSIFRLGSGDGAAFPDTREDGTPICAYGDAVLDASHASNCNEQTADYAVFTSDRFGQSYVARVVRHRLSYNLPEEQTGFQFLRKMIDLQSQIRSLEGVVDRSPSEEAELVSLRSELRESESFVEYLIELQQTYGISSWF